MHILISLMARNSQQGPYYVSRIDSKIVLIDGDQLTQLMIDHDVGVSRVTSYEIKKIDSDYFVELLLTLGTPRPAKTVSNRQKTLWRRSKPFAVF